jgi:hypothetical protein
MNIYAVIYSTGYDYNEILGYYYNLKEAEERAEKVNKENPGIDCYVEEIEVK